MESESKRWRVRPQRERQRMPQRPPSARRESRGEGEGGIGEAVGWRGESKTRAFTYPTELSPHGDRSPAEGNNHQHEEISHCPQVTKSIQR
jgi:hypothetical protein